MTSALQRYIKIARPDHWIKNIFMFPGIAMAFISEKSITTGIVKPLLLGILSCCLISSANYVINEYVDSATDKYHPLKKERPRAKGELNVLAIFSEYLGLIFCGLLLAYQINQMFLLASVFLLCMGIIYNIKPFRTKDIPYLDVLSESVNSVIRFLLGWFIITSTVIPPSSVLLAYWFGGAFLMNTKRYAEYRCIQDHTTAGLYRNSFKYYTEEKLTLASLFYALLTAFFMAIFLIKYKIELLLSFPFFVILFTWYFSIGMKIDSAAQAPEKLYQEPAFLGFGLLTFLVVLFLCMTHIPSLGFLIYPTYIHWN